MYQTNEVLCNLKLKLTSRGNNYFRCTCHSEYLKSVNIDNNYFQAFWKIFLGKQKIPTNLSNITTAIQRFEKPFLDVIGIFSLSEQG